MNRFLTIAGNLVMIAITGGVWIVAIILYLIWKKYGTKPTFQTKQSGFNAPPETPIKVTRPLINDEAKAFIREKQKPLIAVGVTVALISAGVVYGGEFFESRKSNAILQEAEVLLNKNDFKSATAKVQEAIDSNPSASQKALILKNKIAGIETALSLMDEAEDSILKGKFLEAATLLLRVTTTERDLNSKAKSKLSEIQTKVIEQVSSRLKDFEGRNQYEEAISLVKEFERAYPQSDQFSQKSQELTKSFTKQKEALKRAALSRLSKSYDSFQDITWYQSPSSPRYRDTNGFYLYFGVSDGDKLPLRLVFQYYSSDWLFIDSAKINVDGEIYEIVGQTWERDNDSDIWEWTDEPLDDRAMIEAIIKSKSAVIRYEGRQYYDNRTISSAQKAALKQILSAYDLL